MAKDIGELKAKIGADVSGFSEGMAQVKRATQENLNEFKVAASAARAFGTAQDELRAKQAYLSNQLEAQRTKVGLLQQAYAKSVAEKGADAKATLKLANDLATAKAALNNTRADLNKVNAELDQQKGKTNALAGVWNKLKGALGGAGQALKTVGKATAIGIGAAASAVTAVGAGIGKLALDAANTSDELIDMSNVTGLSVERLQELKYAGKLIGTELETMTGSMSKLTRTMDAAKGGNAEAAAAFKTLGVTVTDSNGQLLDNEKVFGSVIDALGKVQNETERDALSMSIFGKSAQELNPLIKAGSGELAKLSNQAHEVGAVMSDEDVQAAGAFKDQLDSLQMGLQGTLGTVGSAFMPALSQIATKGGEYLEQFAGVVKNSNGDFGAMADGVGKLAGQIVQDLTAQMPAMLNAGLAILQGIMAGIMQNLPALVNVAVQMMTALVNFLIQNLPMLMEAAVTLIMALVNGLTTALPQLIPAMVQAIVTMVQALLDNLPMLANAAGELVLALLQGLLNSIPKLVTAIPEMLKALKAAFDNGTSKNIEIGKSIVEGVWQGIVGMKDKFLTDVTDFFGGIIDAVKDALGIASPARVMIPLGKQVPLGFVKGVKQSMTAAQAEISASMRGLALSGGVVAAGAMSESFVFYGPVMIGGAQGERMSQAVKRKRY